MTTRRRSGIFKDRFTATLDAPPPKKKSRAQVMAEEAKKKRGKPITRAQQRARHQPYKNAVTVQPDHQGKIAVCMASGPGLTPEVIEQVRPYQADGSVIVMGLNDVYRACNYLDEFYACDGHWWKYHLANPQDDRHVIDDLSAEGCRLWGNMTAVSDLKPHLDTVNILQGEGSKGFSTNPAFIHWGGNSGFQLLNLAYHLGVERMILAGYNMSVPNKMGAKGHHFFGAHPKPMSQSAGYTGFVKNFNGIQTQIKTTIVNATPDTALTCFEKVDLQDELDEARNVS